MKTKTIILATMLLATGCVSDHPDNFDPDMLITFEPAIGMSTRADANSWSGSVYPASVPFGVWAFSLEGTKSWLENRDESITWLQNAKVVNNGGTWSTENADKWANISDRLSFVCYAPYSHPASYSNNNGIIFKDFNSDTDNTDILFSAPVTDVNKKYCGGVVAIPFTHALTKIGFNVRSAAGSSYEVHLRELKIGNVRYKGTFHSLPQPDWELESEAKEYTVFKGDMVLSEEYGSVSGLMVPAQYQNRPVHIVYDVCMAGSTRVVSSQDFDAKPIVTSWDVGKYYLYNLNVDTDSVNYSTEVIEE